MADLKRKIDTLLQDIGVATALMSRLPLPRLSDATFERQAPATWAFPVVGVLVAGPAALIGVLTFGLGLPASVAAGLMLAVQMAATGAMHEDGLADTVDGFWGGWDRARRLEIMKDSHIGTYGVLALMLSAGLRWAALTALISAGPFVAVVLAAAIFSRGVLPMLMTQMPNARGGGLSQRVGQPEFEVSLVSLGLGAGLALILAGTTAILPVLIGGVAAALVARLAMVKIGGQTGDVLGATQQVVEIAMMICFAAILT